MVVEQLRKEDGAVFTTGERKPAYKQALMLIITISLVWCLLHSHVSRRVDHTGCSLLGQCTKTLSPTVNLWRLCGFPPHHAPCLASDILQGRGRVSSLARWILA